MFTSQIDAAIDAAATLDALGDLARLVWKACENGLLDMAVAEGLEGRIDARRAIVKARAAARSDRSLGAAVARLPRPRPRSPDRAASIARRRRLAFSAPLPPKLAEWFPTGQLAVLAVVGLEAAKGQAQGRPWCDLAMDRIAAQAGVCRTLVRNALRAAQRLGLLRVQERRLSADRSDTNVVTITARAWWAWLRRGGWAHKRNTHENQGSRSRSTASDKAAHGGREGVAASSRRSTAPDGLQGDHGRDVDRGSADLGNADGIG